LEVIRSAISTVLIFLSNSFFCFVFDFLVKSLGIPRRETGELDGLGGRGLEGLGFGKSFGQLVQKYPEALESRHLSNDGQTKRAHPEETR
jgi:hypothetical protein